MRCERCGIDILEDDLVCLVENMHHTTKLHYYCPDCFKKEAGQNHE